MSEPMRGTGVSVRAYAFAGVISFGLLTGCSEGEKPFPARCVRSPAAIEFGTWLPPESPLPLRLVKSFSIENDPPQTGPAGNEDLIGSATIVFAPGQLNPPDIHLVSGETFAIPAWESRTYQIEAIIWRTTSTGHYNGTIDFGSSCATIHFTLSIAAKPEDPPTLRSEWGSEGSQVGQLDSPNSMALDPDGNVYLVDLGNSRIERFDNEGTYLYSWFQWNDPHKAIDDNPTWFFFPAAVTVGPNGSVYVADLDPVLRVNRVTMFNPQGKYLFTWGVLRSGTSIFSGISDLEVDAQSHIFVVDAPAYSVLKFELTDAGRQYVILANWGSRGSENGQFLRPNRIVVDRRNGSVYVSDSVRNMIQKFTNDGAYLLSWGSRGTAPGEFRAPSGLAVDAAGNIFVADTDNRRIQKFDENGAYLSSWELWGYTGQLSNPSDILTTGDGAVLVLDSDRSRVLRYEYVTAP